MSKHANIRGIIVVGGIALVLLLAWVALYVLSTKKSAVVSTLRQDLTTEEKLEESRVSLKKLVAETRADHALINGFFIDEDDAPAFLERIEALGKESGVRVHFTSFEKTDRGLRLIMDARGSFVDVFQFTQLLETMPFKTVFDSTIFHRTTVGDEVLWDGRYTLQIRSFNPSKTP